MQKYRVIFGSLLLVGLLSFGLMQFFQPEIVNQNPQVIKEPAWKNLETKMVFQRACFDCHSNETAWPWYSKIAPVSWLLAKDVADGRAVLNFSDWDSKVAPSAEMVRIMIERGKMPKPQYLAIHPEARLSSAEVELLISEWLAIK